MLSPEPGLISATINVPPDVPSDCQSSDPVAAVNAVKNSLPLKTVRYEGLLLEAPEAMSFTIDVPPDVPSEHHSSMPLKPSVAEKYNLPLKEVNEARTPYMPML